MATPLTSNGIPDPSPTAVDTADSGRGGRVGLVVDHTDLQPELEGYGLVHLRAGDHHRDYELGGLEFPLGIGNARGLLGLDFPFFGVLAALAHRIGDKFRRILPTGRLRGLRLLVQFEDTSDVAGFFEIECRSPGRIPAGRYG